MKIVILERNSVGADVSMAPIKAFGDVTEYTDTTPETVAERIADADIVIANKLPLNESTLKDAANVKIICEFATGYDNIDTEYCKNRGIAVCNVSGYSTEAVVQHTFALCFYLLEHLPYYDEYVKSGAYSAQPLFTNYSKHFTELSGKTWGIVGMGTIGRRVAEVASAFGCRVMYYSTGGNHVVDGYEKADFETLLAQSDFVSLHCPLNEKTKYLMDSRALSIMKPSAILINVARGKVVNNADLAAALASKEIAAAGLDVMEEEPISSDNPLMKIKDSNELVITPHMAWASTEARIRCVAECAENIKAFLNKESRNRIV